MSTIKLFFLTLNLPYTILKVGAIFTSHDWIHHSDSESHWWNGIITVNDIWTMEYSVEGKQRSKFQ